MGAILIQVRKLLACQKLLESHGFKHWDDEEELSRADKKPSIIPETGSVEIIGVTVELVRCGHVICN